MKRLLLLSATAMLVAAVVAGPASAQSNRVEFPGNCGAASFQPRNITVTCADAGIQIRSIRWSSWTTRSARGTGSVAINLCEPTCVDGRTQRYPVRVSLTHARVCTRAMDTQFTLLFYTFTGSRPSGYTRRESQRFGCPD